MMTDQTNPPRTRAEQKKDLIGEFGGFHSVFDEDIADRHIAEAEARGRAEALAELRASAEPIKYEVRDLRISGEKWLMCSRADYDAYQGFDEIETRALYDHPPVARETELAARVAELEAEVSRLQTPQFYGSDDIEIGAGAVEDLFEYYEANTIAEVDGYRRVVGYWAFYNGHEVRLFASEAEASAALAAAPEKRS